MPKKKTPKSNKEIYETNRRMDDYNFHLKASLESNRPGTANNMLKSPIRRDRDMAKLIIENKAFERKHGYKPGQKAGKKK